MQLSNKGTPNARVRIDMIDHTEFLSEPTSHHDGERQLINGRKSTAELVSKEASRKNLNQDLQPVQILVEDMMKINEGSKSMKRSDIRIRETLEQK